MKASRTSRALRRVAVWLRGVRQDARERRAFLRAQPAVNHVAVHALRFVTARPVVGATLDEVYASSTQHFDTGDHPLSLALVQHALRSLLDHQLVNRRRVEKALRYYPQPRAPSCASPTRWPVPLFQPA